MLTAKLNDVSDPQNRFFTDRMNFLSLGTSLLINIIHILLLYFKIGLSPFTILLHYNIVYGPDLVRDARFVYIIPITALVFLIVNIFLARFFFRKEKLAAYFLNFSNIALQLIFLLASIFIIRINNA
jgi:hypothetical protein